MSSEISIQLEQEAFKALIDLCAAEEIKIDDGISSVSSGFATAARSPLRLQPPARQSLWCWLN